jgi:hypothetical protein
VRIGDYETVRLLHRSDKREIYEGRLVSGRGQDTVIVKRLMMLEPRHLDRLWASATRARRLPWHANIVQTHEVEIIEGDLWAVQTRVEGLTLEQLSLNGELAVPMIARIAVSVAAAFEHAHLSKIAHAPIRRDKILIDVEGVVSLCDLGLPSVDDPLDISTKDCLARDLEGLGLALQRALAAHQALAPQLAFAQGGDRLAAVVDTLVTPDAIKSIGSAQALYKRIHHACTIAADIKTQQALGALVKQEIYNLPRTPIESELTAKAEIGINMPNNLPPPPEAISGRLVPQRKSDVDSLPSVIVDLDAAKPPEPKSRLVATPQEKTAISPYEKTAIKPTNNLPKRKRTVPIPFLQMAHVTAIAQEASEAAKSRALHSLEERDRHGPLVVGLALAVVFTFIILAIYYSH